MLDTYLLVSGRTRTLSLIARLAPVLALNQRPVHDLRKVPMSGHLKQNSNDWAPIAGKPRVVW